MNFIKFHWVKCQNLASVGNMPITIQLDKSNTTVVLGNNGVGKSSLILDSLCYALFGKPFRNVTIPQLVNNRNGRGMLVETEFTRGSDKIRVKRGHNPRIFEIFINDKLVDQSAKARDYQKYFEDKILGIDYTAFTQIVMIGKASYTPFMALNKGARRLFVERVLGLDIFGVMTSLHKDKVYWSNRCVEELKTNIKLKGEAVKAQTKLVTHVEQSTKQSLDEKREAVQKQIERHEADIEALRQDKQSIIDSIEQVNVQELKDGKQMAMSRITRIKDLRAVIKSNAATAEREKSFFENNNLCPTCKQSITDEHRHHHIDERQRKLEQFDKSTSELEPLLLEAEQSFDRASKSIDAIAAKIKQAKSIEASIKRIEADISNLTSSKQSIKIDDTKLETEKATLETLKEELAESLSEYNHNSTEANYLNFISLCLKDTGIKSTIINEYIPIINSMVNQNIKKLGLFATVKLDDQFNEEIRIRGFEPMSYNQMSEGEKLRLDMAVMMAWRDVARLKSNMSCNLLIMDEIFDSSVDAEGTQAFADLLKSVSDLNVFVITHTPEKLADSFRSFIRLGKKDGFTTIAANGNY